MEGPIPAQSLPSATLFDVMASVRRALTRRGEYLAPEWFDRAIQDLHTGVLSGWYLPPQPPDAAAFAFVSERPPRGFGHLHIEAGREAVSRGLQLVRRLVAESRAGVDQVDLGLTGLDSTATVDFSKRITEIPGFDVIRRFRLVRPLAHDSPPPATAPPSGFRLVRASTLSLDTLQGTDWEAFRGSPDEQLIAETPEANRRVLEGILSGDLGRFLPEASPALVESSGRLVAFLLAVEGSARRALLVDFAVLPEFRHRGLGHWTLGWSLRALTALGYGEVELWVTETNMEARNLYGRFSFVPRAESAIYRWRRVASSSGRLADPQPHSAR